MALQLHWKFDETSGTTAADSSGNSRNGTVNGTSFTTGAVTGAGGTLGGGLLLDGVNDYISRSATAFNGYTAFSFSLWTKKTTSGFTNSDIHGFSAGVWGGAGSVFFEPHEVWPGGGSGGGTAFRFDNTWFSYSDPSWTTSDWHHFAITYDGTNVKIYRDSVLKYTSSTVSGKSLSLSGWDLQVGAMVGFGRYYPGTVDDFRIYDHALTGSEVTDLFNLSTGGGGSSAAFTLGVQRDIGQNLSVATGDSIDVGTHIEVAAGFSVVTGDSFDSSSEIDTATSFGISVSESFGIGIERDVAGQLGISASASFTIGVERDVADSFGTAVSFGFASGAERDIATSFGTAVSFGFTLGVERDIPGSIGTSGSVSFTAGIDRNIATDFVPEAPPPSSSDFSTAINRNIGIGNATIISDGTDTGTIIDVGGSIGTATGDLFDLATERDIAGSITVPGSLVVQAYFRGTSLYKSRSTKLSKLRNTRILSK